MKKSILITSLTLTMISIVLYHTPTVFGMTREEILEPASRESTWEYLDSQPTHVSTPAELPSSIQDPLLMAGWVYLYNQENRFSLWDSSLLSGRMLAEYILENEVSILWGSADICNGRSCSPRPTCTPESCTEQQPPVDPIYIASTFKNISESELTMLVEQIAHETFHHTKPFGRVDDTLFEEYWAFYVGMQVIQNVWADFESYDSTCLPCLKLWFMQHKLMVYLKIEPYPQSMIDSANLDMLNCPTGPGGQINIYAIISNDH